MHRMLQPSSPFGYADTPIGRVLLVGRPGVLTGLYFDGCERTPTLAPGSTRSDGLFDDVRRQLDEYFQARRVAFDLAIDPPGTPFQRAMWDALIEVRCGETETYGELAQRLGGPRASRAVGAANGANPISIVIPCHRLVGASGDLTGYGWGVERKAWLLEHERDLLRTLRS